MARGCNLGVGLEVVSVIWIIAGLGFEKASVFWLRIFIRGLGLGFQRCCSRRLRFYWLRFGIDYKLRYGFVQAVHRELA